MTRAWLRRTFDGLKKSRIDTSLAWVFVEKAMGTLRCSGRVQFRVASITALLMLTVSGCQVLLPPVTSKRLIHPQPFLDLTGLLPRQQIEALRVSWAVPRDWGTLPVKRGAIYAHQQYRSPTGLSGVGVAYIRMPFPVPASTIAWFAKNEYLKRARDQQDGKLIGRWTDADGREWFEAENNNITWRAVTSSRGWRGVARLQRLSPHPPARPSGDQRLSTECPDDFPEIVSAGRRLWMGSGQSRTDGLF